MKINVPIYSKDGFEYVWDEGFFINCSIDNSCIYIEANKEGLISLARHMLELAQDNVPEFEHIHLDEYNSLEDNSVELVIVKKNNL